MKIKFGEEHLYIDPSFVQIKDSVSSRKFLKVKNSDINLNPSTLLDERTLNLVSPYQLPSHEDLNYKSTEKISEKDHPDNKQTLFRNQRQSNAYDTREGTNEIDEINVVSRRSYDQVSKQETTYKIDSDEVEQDDKIEEDNDDNEFDYNNSSEIKLGDADTTDYPSESPGEPVSVNQQPSSVQSHHVEMKVSGTEHVENHVPIRPPTVSPDTDKELKEDVSSRSEQGERVSVNQQPSSVQPHHVEMKVSGTEHMENHVPIRPPTVSPDTDKELKEDVSSRSEQGERVSVNHQPSSVQSNHVEMKVSGTEHVENHVPIRPPTVSPDTDKELKEDVSSRSEQGERVSVNHQPSSVQPHHVEMKVSGTEHVENHVPIRPPTVSPDTDKELKEDVSSRSEQGERVSVNHQPSSVQSNHVEMKVSGTEHVENHVPIRPPTVSPDTDKELKEDVSSRSEQGERVSVNQQPSSVQPHHVEMKVSGTEHVENHVPIRPPTVSPDTDKELKEDVSSRSEQGERVSVNQQPSSVQPHHVEMKVSGTEHVENHVPIRPPTVSPDTDKELKEDVSSRSEQGERVSVNQQPSSVQPHHVEMKVSGTENVENHVPIRPPTVSPDTDKELKEDVSSRSEQGERVSVNQQPSSVQPHHVEMKVSGTEHVENHVPIRPPTVSSDTDKELKEDVSSRSEQGERVSVNQQPSSVQPHHVEMKVSGTEHVENHVPIRPPTVSSDTDKELKEDVSSRSEQGERVSVNQQPSSVQPHHVEMKVSGTEHVENHVPIRPPTVSPDTDKELKEDVSSRSEQGERVSVNQQPSSVQPHHVEMKVSGTEHMENHVPIRPPTVSPDTDKELKEDVSSRSEQGERVSVNQQPSSVQPHHVEMKVSGTEHVENHVPIRPPTVSPDTDKELKEDVSSRSEQGERVSVNHQPSSVQSNHVEMKVSGTEHVENHVPIRPPTVSPDTDKELKEDVSSRSEQGERVSVNHQPSSVQPHHVEMKVSGTEHVENHVPIRPPTVSPDTDKELKEDVSSRSEQGERVSVNHQPSSVQPHHVEMKVSGTEHVENHVPIRPPTVSPDTDKELKEDVSSRSEQGERVSVNQQPSSVQPHHVEMKVSGTEHVENHVPIRPPTVSPDTDKESNVDVSQVSYSTSSSDLLDNVNHIESNMSNSHFSLHDRKQGVITSDLVGVQDIGIIYSSDVNSSTLSSVSRKMSEDQIIFDHHSVPVRLGLIQCIYWAANASFDKTYSKTVRSPFSRFLVNGFRYFFAAANVSLQYLPENIISNLDNFLLETFSLSVNFIIAWMIFIFHLIFMWNLSKGVHFLLSKYIFSEKYTSPSLVEYLKLEEYSIQLASQLSDTEESNSHLSKWANSLSSSLQNLQEEYTSKLSEMTLSMDDSRESFIRAQSELNHLKNTHNSLEQNLRLKLTDKEEVIHELNSEINRLKQLHSENDDKWKKSLLDLEESNRKSIEELKEEQEQLYSQANLYYNRMKTMQSEVDKILESRKASEEKLLIKEAEFQSLLATFNTLKGLEVIFEQESSSKQETNDMEEREVTTTDNLSNVSRTLEDDVEISDKSSIISESALCDLNEVDEKITEKSRLQKNLSLLLDVGRLHAQIRLKDEQIKAEESKAKNEHDLRVEVESKMEEIERENSALKANLIHIEQERNAYQTKLDILSCYFKERELELQRDLGKHVVVGSESSEALMHSRKRNQELEGKLKYYEIKWQLYVES
ncbi:unnamed protein product [Schistosoma mattheei]|uniref:Uncharacterized protein n=1 Tax=Schistosoma mattheei TaxID=31246 RepID=A0AA85BPH8_9TREM|nr:unnamed protein product [Schistosoma mattheei]